LNILILLYWFSAYTLGIVTLAGAWLLYRRTGLEYNRELVIFLGACAGIVIALTIKTFLELSGSIWEMRIGSFTLLLSFLSLAYYWGIGLLIYIYPRFSHRITRTSMYRQIEKIALVSSMCVVLVLTISMIIFGITGNIPVGMVVSISAIALFILYLSGFGYSLIVVRKENVHEVRKGIIGNIRILFLGSVLLVMSGALGSIAGILFTQLKEGAVLYILVPAFYIAINLYCLPAVVRNLLSGPAGRLDAELIKQMKISGREEEVIECLLKGNTYKEIAARLFISLATVQSHITSIYQKAGVNGKVELLNKLLVNN
jgi:DNA-binding CsgD family transcriptional regulator